MEGTKKNSGIIVLMAVFALVNVVLVLLKDVLVKNEIDFWVVFWGNIIVFAATLVAYFLFGGNAAPKKGRGQAVVKQVYAGFVVKFFLLVTAVMVYFYFAENINVKAVFICFGLYFMYNLLNVKAATAKAKRTVHKPH
jgi:hypothetical protein